MNERPTVECVRRATGPRVEGQRGVALIVVLTLVTVLAALAVDMQYNARVDLQLAAGARDEMRAHYMARSAYNLTRLVLYFQKMIDDLWARNRGGIAGQVLGAIGKPNVYELVPIECGFLSGIASGAALPGLLGFEGEEGLPAPDVSKDDGDDEEEEDVGLLGKSGFENLSGDCNAEIDSEHRLNINQLAGFQDHKRHVIETARQWKVGPHKGLFERTDEDGHDMKLETILSNILDYIDEDEQKAYLGPEALEPTAPLAGDVFQPDFGGGENDRYPSGDDGYQPKNNRLDTIDELYLVPGVDDLFMEAFSDDFTVYPTGGIDITSPGGRDRAIRLALAMALDPALWLNPAALQQVLAVMAEQMNSLEWFGLLDTVDGFISFVDQVIAGGSLPPDKKAFLKKNLTDRSSVYRITAQGRVGDAVKTITAVLNNNSNDEILYYWRED